MFMGTSQTIYPNRRASFLKSRLPVHLKQNFIWTRSALLGTLGQKSYALTTRDLRLVT